MKNLPLRWRLTLMTAALMAAACLLLNLFISCSAVMSIQEIEDYVVEISPAGQETFQLDFGTLYPDLQEQLQQTISGFRVQSIFATLAIILLGCAFIWFLAGRGLAPIKKFCAQMETIQAQNLSELLEIPDTKDEISQLTLSFNKMLARLDRAFTVQRQFAANAAHELRTPLAVVRAELDVLQKKNAPAVGEYAQTLQSVSDQTEQLSRVVEALLEMTGLETIERRDHISLFALTEEVLCDLAQVAEEKKVALVQDPGDAELTGSDTLLYRAVYNLVENAIKYNRPGGEVRDPAGRRHGPFTGHGHRHRYPQRVLDGDLRPVCPGGQVPKPGHGRSGTWAGSGSGDRGTPRWKRPGAPKLRTGNTVPF